MHGAREILTYTADAVHIERQIKAIEHAVFADPSMAFDLSRALVEGACKTILRDRGHSVPEHPKLPALFWETLTRLQIVPDSHIGDKKLADSLRKTAGGLHTVVQGLCELRDLQGSASHGKYADTVPLEPAQAILSARAADTVVSFLFRVHRDYLAQPKPKKLEYRDSEEFNDFLDQSNDPVRIFDLTYTASEVLYAVDYQAYVDMLGSYSTEEADEPASSGASEVPA
jgi:hypothetical protein